MKTEMEWDQAARRSKHHLSQSGWEHVHHCNTAGYDATDVRISVWRLSVPGGRIYKVTELDNGYYHRFPENDAKNFFESHRSVSICFVPKVTMHK
jgi:hypothetical protein